MEKENNKGLKKGTLKSFDPKKAILIFVVLVLIVPFYESKRILIWATQRTNQKGDFFNSLLVSYVKGAERMKAQLGLDTFFEKEHYFWLDLKKSPVIFEKNIVPPPPLDVKDGESIDGKVVTTSEENEPDASFAGENNTSSLTASEPAKKMVRSKASYRILIIGDSFMAIGGGVGNPLERDLLNYKDLDVYRCGRVSSGLSRPDYFNWNLKVQELISQYSPNIAIVMFGSNDAQAITTPKGKVVVGYGSVGTEKWNKEYAKRVRNLLNLFKENNITVFWIGLPMMKKKDFSKKIENINSIYKKEIEKYDNAYFIPTWHLLTDKQGNYTAYLPDKNGKMRLARASDGVHLTYFAGNLVAKEVISKMEEVFKLEAK